MDVGGWAGVKAIHKEGRGEGWEVSTCRVLPRLLFCVSLIDGIYEYNMTINHVGRQGFKWIRNKGWISMELQHLSHTGLYVRGI